MGYGDLISRSHACMCFSLWAFSPSTYSEFLSLQFDVLFVEAALDLFQNMETTLMYKFIQYTNFYFKYLILSTRICNKNLNVYKIIFRDKYLK